MRHARGRTFARWLGVVMVSGVMLSAGAADHGDGYTVSEHPRFDITDYFIFPHLAEDGSKRLAFVLSVHPNASFATQFDPGISYRVKTRTITGFNQDPFTANVLDDELMVDCRVAGERAQDLTCRLYRLIEGWIEEEVIATNITSTKGSSYLVADHDWDGIRLQVRHTGR